jgi:hypothetical protein
MESNAFRARDTIQIFHREYRLDSGTLALALDDIMV